MVAWLLVGKGGNEKYVLKVSGSESFLIKGRDYSSRISLLISNGRSVAVLVPGGPVILCFSVLYRFSACTEVLISP